jgi:hypothetical protein
MQLVAIDGLGFGCDPPKIRAVHRPFTGRAGGQMKLNYRVDSKLELVRKINQRFRNYVSKNIFWQQEYLE